MIEARQVSPHHGFSVLPTEGMGDAAVGVAKKPFRVLPSKLGIHSTMINDEVHHHPQSVTLGRLRGGFNLPLRRERTVPIQEAGIYLKVIGNGVKASRLARFLNGIHKDPVKPHIGGALNVTLPIAECAGERRKQVINNHQLFLKMLFYRNDSLAEPVAGGSPP